MSEAKERRLSELVYLACPYSDPDADVRSFRFFMANCVAARLMSADILIYSPVTHTHPIALAGELPKGWDFWEKYDREYLNVCRAIVVLMLDGWEISKGVKAEIAIMQEQGKPVYYVVPEESMGDIARRLRSV